MKKVDKKLKNLRKNFNFTNNELKILENIYCGIYDVKYEETLNKLIYESKKMWSLYYEINNKLACKPTFINYIKAYLKKKKIIKIIFPTKTKNLMLSNMIYATIGMVDVSKNVFINYGVNFGERTLVEIGKNTQIAPGVVFESQLNNVNKVTVGSDVWLCASSVLKGNINICDNVVVALGSVLDKDISKSGVYINNTFIKDCFDKSDYFKYVKKENAVNKDEIRNEFSKSGFKLNKTFLTYMSGHAFNNVYLSGLYIKTHRLVDEYNCPSTSSKRKQEILDMLFIHGKNLKVNGNIYVDLLKTVKIGDDVTIGNNCYLGGNIEIMDKVILEDDVTIFSVGHSLSKTNRRMRFDFTHGLISGGRSDKTIITSNKVIKTGSKIGPNKEI